MVAMRYHLDYPRVMNPKIKNSWLPQDMGPEVKFNMLPFIMFNSTSGLGHGNNSDPRNWYIAPYA